MNYLFIHLWCGSIEYLNEQLVTCSLSGGAAYRTGVQVGDKIIKVSTYILFVFSVKEKGHNKNNYTNLLTPLLSLHQP